MSAPVRRIIFNPANPREARTAAERIVRALDLPATTTTERAEGWLRTTVWTVTEADSATVAAFATARHVRAQIIVGDNHEVIINWRKL